MPTPIRLIALDLDGTLLSPQKHITQPTLDALLSISARGVHVVLASARPPRGVRPFYRALNLATPQINYNGSAIYLEPSRSFTYHQPLDPAAVASLAALIDSHFPQAIYSVEHLDRWITHDYHHPYLMETAKLAPPDILTERSAVIAHQATKLMLHGPPETLDRLPFPQSLPPGLRMYRTDPFLLQFVHASSSKAAALQQICAQLDVPISQVFAAGDADNDIEMLRLAGTSAAMGDSPPEVQHSATFTTKSNREDGVLHALQQLNLV